MGVESRGKCGKGWGGFSPSQKCNGPNFTPFPLPLSTINYENRYLLPLEMSKGSTFCRSKLDLRSLKNLPLLLDHPPKLQSETKFSPPTALAEHSFLRLRIPWPVCEVILLKNPNSKTSGIWHGHITMSLQYVWAFLFRLVETHRRSKLWKIRKFR